MQEVAGAMNLRGVNIHYRQLGPRNGTPLVMIHGWGSSGRMWRPTMLHFSDRFHCVTLDLPGHGRSMKPDHDWYTIPRFGDVVAEFTDQLDLECPILMGHSMGGTIALRLASERRLSVRALVVVNPVIAGEMFPRHLSIEDRLFDRLLTLGRGLWPLATRLLDGAPRALRRRWPGHVQRNTKDLAHTTADSALGSFRAVLQEDLRKELGAISIPTLVLVGSGDNTVPPAQGVAAAAAIPDADLVMLPAGHHPPDEIPELYLERVERFLSRAEHR